jgi:hypothetical protein
MLVDGGEQNPPTSSYPSYDNTSEGKQGGKKENMMAKNQKIIVISLGVFAFFILIFWATSLKNTIYSPFQIKENKDSGLSVTDQNSDEALRSKDTDKDGISDFDELNIYKTSPYLPDTDGDGATDNNEIKSGADPNCPAGRVCGGVDPLYSETAKATGTAVTANQDQTAQDADKLEALLKAQNETQATQASSSQPSQGLNSDLYIKILNGTVDAKTLRELMAAQGMKKEQLDKISDEKLLQTYKDSLNKTQSSTAE